MNKYEYIYGQLATKLGTLNGTFNNKVFPLTYLRVGDDDTKDLIGVEFGLSKNYDRTVLCDLFYQNKYTHDPDNEQIITNQLNDKSDELELLLTTGLFEGEYIHLISTVEKYRINITGIKIIFNARAVSEGIGQCWIQFEINYNQSFT